MIDLLRSTHEKQVEEISKAEKERRKKELHSELEMCASHLMVT